MNQQLIFKESRKLSAFVIYKITDWLCHLKYEWMLDSITVKKIYS